MLNTLTTRLKHERRQRLVADDWTSLLTRELDAHISARTCAEDELQRNRQLLRQLAADVERLKQGRDRALEQQVLQQLNDSQTGSDLSGGHANFFIRTHHGMNIVLRVCVLFEYDCLKPSAEYFKMPTSILRTTTLQI